MAGKGVISVAEFGPRGPLEPPRPVLERPFHLSYPYVFQRDGAFWMVPESVGAGASTSIAPRNSRSAARPAGSLFERGAALCRPVQDCRAGYGAALGFARIGRLDENDFAQSLETIVRPSVRDWPGSRLHTFNAAGDWGFIDGSALAPRRSALGRLTNARLRRERLGA